MAQVPFQFGLLDEFSRRAVSQSMQFEQMAGTNQGFLSQLQAANEADVAPKIDLPEMRGANMAQGIGAILQNIVDPGAAERFASQQAQVRQFNAQLQAQEAVQNQVQEGYLQRRKQERQELMAKLQADSENVRAKLDASLRELGIERDAQTAKMQAEAARKDREQDLMLNSKWLSEHGDGFHMDMAQYRIGQTKGPDGEFVPLTDVDRDLIMSRLEQRAISAPPGPLRDKLFSDIRALEAADEERKRLEQLNAPPATRASAGSFGPNPEDIQGEGLTQSIQRGLRSVDTTEESKKKLIDIMFPSAYPGDLWADVANDIRNIGDLWGLLSTDMPADIQGLTSGSPLTEAEVQSFNDIIDMQRRALPDMRVKQAIGQESPTRR